MKRPSDGRGDRAGCALVAFLLVAWGGAGFAAGVAWAVTAPVCAAPVAAPWVLLLAWP